MTDGLDDLYGGSLALLTDLYQLTMAAGYWKAGHAEREAVFHLTFRRPPFGGGYAIAAGIESALAYLRRLSFTEDDVAYLATLVDGEDKPLFEPAFLAYLRELRFSCTVDAVPEGSLVFAHEPIVRVRGPILQAQLVETPLLTLINYQTLIATKAARIVQVAGGPVVEFGLRRAHGIDGGISAARAAYIGGADATSNVLAGKLLGIPIKGTHAHSWVMFHDDELSAFREYAKALPGNCVFLVDTYDTLDGVRHAIEVGHELRARGHELAGIRLDSGDLAHLSIEARALLDEAGFPNAKILASNDLDEHLIANIREQGAKIDVWGVGTKLVTAFDQPALGGVYKLGAYRDEAGNWRYPIKLSEQPIKITNPGILQIRRCWKGDQMIGDILYEDSHDYSLEAHDIELPTRSWNLEGELDRSEDLLVTVLDAGAPTGRQLSLEAARQRAAADLQALSPRTKRFLNPQPYPVGLDDRVHERKQELIAEARSHHA